MLSSSLQLYLHIHHPLLLGNTHLEKDSLTESIPKQRDRNNVRGTGLRPRWSEPFATQYLTIAYAINTDRS